MKNTVKIFLCAVLALGVLFSFGACGAKEQTAAPESPVVKQYVTGRYELEKIEYAGGLTTTGDVLQQAEDTMGDMYVELFSDGTAQLALYGQINDMEFSGDKMWQIDLDLATYDFSVSDGRVTLKRDGETYTFVKK